MSRTIESIMASHDAATALRKASKPIWTYKVMGIRAIISDDSLDRNAKGQKIAKTIRASRWARSLEEGDSLFIALEQLEDTLDDEDFNYWLDEIYDMAVSTALGSADTATL